jgi:hypothetical protein
MQIRLFREHKNDAALKCEIQDFPTKAFQLVIGGFLERAPLHRLSPREYLKLLSAPSRDDQRGGPSRIRTLAASGSEVSPL